MPPGPAWLRKLLGDDLFVTMTLADFKCAPVNDAGLEPVKGLTDLQWLFVDGGPFQGSDSFTTSIVVELNPLVYSKDMRLIPPWFRKLNSVTPGCNTSKD